MDNIAYIYLTCIFLYSVENFDHPVTEIRKINVQQLYPGEISIKECIKKTAAFEISIWFWLRATKERATVYICELMGFSLLATHIRFVYCVITAVQNVRIHLFPIGNLASNQIHKLRNVMATANEFVSGDDFEAILFLFQTQSNCVSS